MSDIIQALVSTQPDVMVPPPLTKMSKKEVAAAIADSGLIVIKERKLRGIANLGQLISQLGINEVGRGCFMTTMDGLLSALDDCNKAIKELQASGGNGSSEVEIDLQRLRAELLSKQADVGERIIKSRPQQAERASDAPTLQSFTPGTQIPIVTKSVTVVVNDAQEV